MSEAVVEPSACPSCRGEIATLESTLAKRRTSTVVATAIAAAIIAVYVITDPSSALGLVATLLILTITVLIHEYGHLRAARRAGVLVSEFAVGFGPVVAARSTKSGLVLSARALPLGGFCRVAGMSPNDRWCDEHSGHGDLLNTKRLRTQVWVMLAGVTNNVILAWAILCGLIIHATHTWTWRLLLVPCYAAKMVATLLSETLSGLWDFVGKLFVHHDTSSMTSVVGMPGQFNQMHHQASTSSHPASVWVLGAIFMAVVSISLAVMNTLPLAALDGGHVVMAVWNAITQRRHHRAPSPRAVATFQAMTLAPFAALMVFVMARDVVHLF